MFSRVSSAILALLFFFVFSSGSANQWYFFSSVAFLVIASCLINIRRIGLSWSHLLLPVLYLFATASVYVVISSASLRLVFLLAATLCFYLIELQLGKESHFLQNIFLFSVFAIFLGIFALDFYVQISPPALSAMFFVASLVFIVQGFAGFSLPVKKYFVFLTALIIAQLSWGISLWPTHYTVNAAILFSVFYLLWIFSVAVFFGKLTWKKAILQAGLVVLALAAILSAAAWRQLIG